MFDAITEDNFIGRGESDYDDGEDNNQTHNIKRFRQQIEHLNCDLHDLIYSGEEDEDGDLENLEGQDSRNRAKVRRPRKSGKP